MRLDHTKCSLKFKQTPQIWSEENVTSFPTFGNTRTKLHRTGDLKMILL